MCWTIVQVLDTEKKSIIDGDTIELEGGQRVRYIGIDTPETAHPEKAVECFGAEASRLHSQLNLPARCQISGAVFGRRKRSPREWSRALGRLLFIEGLIPSVAASAAAVVTAKSAASAALARFLRTRFTDDNVAAIKSLARKLSGFFGSFLRRHFHKAKTARSARFAIAYDRRRNHRSRLREKLFQRGVGSIPRQTAHK